MKYINTFEFVSFDEIKQLFRVIFYTNLKFRLVINDFKWWNILRIDKNDIIQQYIYKIRLGTADEMTIIRNV